MWVVTQSIDGEMVTGVVASKPYWRLNLNEGAVVSFPVSDVSDWIYVSDRGPVGNFTGGA